MTQAKQRSATGHVLLPASNPEAREAPKPLHVHGDVGCWTFGRGTVVWTIWPAVLLHTVFAAAVTSISLATTLNLAVPQVLINVLGVVIGFVISYRAMSGYDKYWQGRSCWSDVIKNARTMSRLIWIHVPLKVDKNAPPNDYNQTELCLQEKRLALDLVEGFAVALKHHLRGETGIYYEDLYRLVTPLHEHAHSRLKLKPLPPRPPQISLEGLSPAVDATSPISPSRRKQTIFPDPVIPAINEYGTFGSESCASSDESVRPFLFPATPKRSTNTRILTELVPFSSFFSSTGPIFGRRKRRMADFFPKPDDNDSITHSEMWRRYSDSSRKFRPLLAGGGRNVPLEILHCLSEWLCVLEERGVVPGNPLGAMYGCVTAFEESLTSLEKILSTPLPFVYSAHIRQCVWLYLFLLPFQVVNDYGWYTIPGVCVAAFFYIGFLAAGEEIEQPFGYDENDLDLDLFCRSIIEADIETLKQVDYPNTQLLKTERTQTGIVSNTRN